MREPRIDVVPAEAWADCAADAIGAILQSALASGGGRCCAALAGGTTPAPVYRALAGRLGGALEWSGVDLFLSDERVVPADDPRSNYRTVAVHLLQQLEEPRPTLHPVATQLSAHLAARSYEELIRRTVPRLYGTVPAFDLILLGLGGDGHTASLFPADAALDESVRLVAPTRERRSGELRITFTPPLLAAARQLLFLVSGPEKADVFARIQGGGQEILPARRVERLARAVRWIVDEEAAAKSRIRRG